METYATRDPSGARMLFTLAVSDPESNMLGKEVIRAAVDKMSEHIAAIFLEEHQTEILKMLDPQAVANLAVAASGGAIREMLGKKMPDVTHIIREPGEDRIYQKGIFGGLKRIR